MERTLLIIKPDAVSGHHVGDVISVVERSGFAIVQMRMLRMDGETARRLYAPHAGKPFFEPLVEFMTSGPVVACVLEREGAVLGLRALLGDTDSRKAVPGTIRALYGTDKQVNAAHGSDSRDSYLREASVFFQEGTY